MSNAADSAERHAQSGVLIGLAAYTMWGVFPVYFKLIESVAPLEVLTHRVVWAVPFGALIIALRSQWSEVKVAFGHRRMMLGLCTSALFITINWLIYIWAIQNGRIFESSLGYYINPLLYVLVGVLFLGERLRTLQIAAVVLASIGVLFLTINGGVFPWVALSLAASFTVYGVIRKQIVVGAMPGLFVETSILFPFALGWLIWIVQAGQASIVNADTKITLLLLLGGPITVVPLLMFAIAARRLTMTAIGFMQFLAPTLQFLTGVYYGETLTPAHMVCFAFIWAAVVVFSIDAMLRGRKKPLREIPAKA